MVRALRSGKAAVWQERLRRFADGESSVTEFCRQEGVSSAAFYLWRKRLAQAGKPAHAAATQFFLPVRLTTASCGPIIIGLPNGVRVRLPGDNLEALKAGIEAAAALPVMALAAAGKEARPC